MEVIILAGLYFVPWLIALVDGHRDRAAIFILNLLLGWTIIGWIVALVWAFKKSAPAGQSGE